MKTIEVKTSELEGAALDWAVAVIEGHDVIVHGVGTYRYDKRGGIHCCKYGCTFGPRSLTSDSGEYSPSTNWSQGGPLIEKYGIELKPLLGTAWSAIAFGYRNRARASSLLIAACRVIVAAKLGAVVQVPAELIGEQK